MVRLLDEAGIIHFGGPRDHFQENPVHIEIAGLKIFLLGYYIEESLQESERNDLLQRILNIVKHTETVGSILILSLHWGNEYTDKPYSWILQAGKDLIDNGADILFGHHSHTFQGVTEYNGGIFAPSMGNFVFQDCFKKNRRSALLQVEFSQSGFRYKTIPLYIDKTGTPYYAPKEKYYLDSLNENLSDAMNKSYAELSDWDKDALKQVKTGHFKNRWKIRLNILAHPVKYFPFILSRYGN
jgi:poly-gamma-glutamate synthesis protein (capsule biosynthesis protein)